jgi:protocatechuate 3,4-dioxygenase beta subunit
MADARIHRRVFLGALGLPATVALGSPSRAAAQGPPLRATPSCGTEPTPRQTEGPYFKPASPRRVSLIEPGMPGTRILISGRVLSTDCKPIARALLDAWQADARGEYDNAGFTLRGHQFTGEGGRYALETVVPGLYPGRTRHIHVKVQAPGQAALTTQLYFPGEPQNRRDGLYDPALLVEMRDAADGKVATFDFVLRVQAG